MSKKQITRNAEERLAFEALKEALINDLIARDVDLVVLAEEVERDLLASGWCLTKIEEVKGLREVVDEYNEERRKSSSLGFFD